MGKYDPEPRKFWRDLLVDILIIASVVALLAMTEKYR